LVASKPDLLIASSTPGAQAAKRVAGGIPYRIACSQRPSDERHSVQPRSSWRENLGGLEFPPGDEWKTVELLKTVVPTASRVAVLGNPSNAGKEIEFRELGAAGRSLGLTTVALEIGKSEDIDVAFATMKRARPDALVTLLDGVTLTGRKRIVDEALDLRLPTMFQVREFADAGGLLSYGLNYCDHYQRAARYVDRILKGAKPGDLPVEQPTKFELVINLKTAKALGLTIPQSVLLRADEVIQ